jgi:hypothetical protein
MHPHGKSVDVQVVVSTRTALDAMG